MKIKTKIFTLFTFLLFTFFLAFPANLPKANAYAVSKAEAVMERDSLRLLSGVNVSAKLPMASTTKIVTALTVIENYDLDKVLTVPKQTVGVEGSSVYLREGEKYTVKDLLYGLMLRSGNDCAETLAVVLSGSIENFTALMNKTAVKYGADSSNFTNPHGLPDNSHYTTAEDLCKISCAAMRNSEFKEIVSSKKHTATELVSGEKRVWVNKNKMLSSYSGASGVKTGFTVKAGRCLVSSAERNGMEVVCVVLNSPQMFERSKELLDNAFARFDLVKLVDKDRFDYSIPTDNGKYIPIGINKSFYYPVEKGEKIDVEVNLPKEINEKEAAKGKEVGEVKIYCEKHLIFCEKIYTINVLNRE